MLILDEKDDGLDSSSRVLVIQSLLRPLNGVDNVQVLLSDKASTEPAETTNPVFTTSWQCQVLIDHDMQTTPDQLVSLLQQSLRCSARMLTIPEETRDQPVVRSQLQVQGMCCASEIPSIQKILRLPSVSKVQINITTQTVYLQHNASILSARDIANKLTQQGFSTKILKDGAATRWERSQASSSHQSGPSVGRTALHVEHVLTEQDISDLPQVWATTEGVVRVGVNVRESVVYIEHDVHRISSEELLNVLLQHKSKSDKIYVAKVVVNGKAEMEQREFEAFATGLTPSKYVESTLFVSNLTLRHVPLITKALKQNYIRAQVRAFYPHVPSRIVKVEHNPELLGIQLIVDLLTRYGLQASITVDGAVDGLALPLMEDYPSNGFSANLERDDLRSSLRLNVVLSGIFWLVSVLSFLGGML
jgi:copper chaperone CopZ